jgi:hypothetical protein
MRRSRVIDLYPTLAIELERASEIERLRAEVELWKGRAEMRQAEIERIRGDLRGIKWLCLAKASALQAREIKEPVSN